MFSFANTIESLPCEKRPGARASNPLQSSGPSFFLELLLTPFPRLGKLFGNATFDGLRQTRQNNGFFCEILLRNDSPANCLPSCFSSAACNSARLAGRDALRISPFCAKRPQGWVRTAGGKFLGGRECGLRPASGNRIIQQHRGAVVCRSFDRRRWLRVVKASVFISFDSLRALNSQEAGTDTESGLGKSTPDYLVNWKRERPEGGGLEGIGHYGARNTKTGPRAVAFHDKGATPCINARAAKARNSDARFFREAESQQGDVSANGSASQQAAMARPEVRESSMGAMKRIATARMFNPSLTGSDASHVAMRMVVKELVLNTCTGTTKN